MPLGNYKTFAACVADYVSKGYSEEEARRICGAIERDTKSSQSESKKTQDDGKQR